MEIKKMFDTHYGAVTQYDCHKLIPLNVELFIFQ
jgi:hypothetical protein